MIPPEVVEALGSGKDMFGVSAEHRQKAGLKGGDRISVEVPAELASALYA